MPQFLGIIAISQARFGDSRDSWRSLGMRLLGFLIRQPSRLLKVVLLSQRERFEVRSPVDPSTTLITGPVRHTAHAGEFKEERYPGL
jgi:hypothetical protein